MGFLGLYAATYKYPTVRANCHRALKVVQTNIRDNFLSRTLGLKTAENVTFRTLKVGLA